MFSTFSNTGVCVQGDDFSVCKPLALYDTSGALSSSSSYASSLHLPGEGPLTGALVCVLFVSLLAGNRCLC